EAIWQSWQSADRILAYIFWLPMLTTGKNLHRARGQRPVQARRRWIVAEIVGACMVVLVMAQALTAMLSQTAFRTLATTTTAERVDLLAREAAGRINTGLRLGKPLAQYFGLERQLGQSLDHLPDLVGAVVLLPSGYELTRIGTPPDIPSG